MRRHTPIRRRRLTAGRHAAVALFAAAAGAHAQWTVVSLHPAGAAQSRAWSVRNGQQVGQAYFQPGISHAVLWSGTPESFIDLNPPNSVGSWARGVWPGYQAGIADAGAVVWTGSSASPMILTPAGARGAAIYNVVGGQQVGYVGTDPGPGLNPIPHASLWSGTPSWIDLHPAGADDSAAQGIYSGEQAGYASFGGAGLYHAGFWTGTAASWVDLHPAGAVQSRALAMYNRQQVGWAIFDPTPFSNLFHAALWTGTAASWVDLNPPGAPSSTAFAVWARRQAGWAYVHGQTRAGIWSGTAESWEELPTDALGGAWGTYALSIWSDASRIYVAGYGLGGLHNRNEALLWSRPIVPCYANCDNSTGFPALNIEDFICFQTRFAAADPYADCDQSGSLNAGDFVCFQGRYVAGCP
jgi:hypothetical protein